MQLRISHSASTLLVMLPSFYGQRLSLFLAATRGQSLQSSLAAELNGKLHWLSGRRLALRVKAVVGVGPLLESHCTYPWRRSHSFVAKWEGRKRRLTARGCSLQKNYSRVWTEPGEQAVSIREAKGTDAVAMGEIEALCFGYWDATELQAEIGAERTVLLVAEDSSPPGSVVGLILVWCVADEAQIIEVAVHPKAQRRGIGLQLMEEALKICSRRVKATAGRGSAVLEVKAENNSAISLYQRLGFKQVGLRRDYYPDGADAILMRLSIL